MKPQTKEILTNTFYQLLVLYSALILLVILELFSKYSFHMEIFALLLGILGIVIIDSKKENWVLKKGKREILFVVSILFIIFIRILPTGKIPLGYDAGIYRYGIEKGLANLDNWILNGGMEPFFLYLMEFFKLFFSGDFILTYFLVFFCVLLGIAIYYVSKIYFNSKIGIISLLIYAVSIIQFKTFTYMYYKNIVGLIFLLFSIYFLKKSRKDRKYIWIFIFLAGLLGAIHRPTFYIFGLSYFFYSLISPYFRGKYHYELLFRNSLYGILILIISGLFYIGKFSPAITTMFEPVLSGFIQPGESPGTFINFLEYQFSTLMYLPFAILGFFTIIKRKKFDMIFYLTIITSIIVYFQFFFFNRFLIHLDIFLIILSGVGFSKVIKEKRKLGIILLILLLVFSGISLVKESVNTKPLINENELESIKLLDNFPGEYVISTSSIYSPWILGYTNKKVIAPGLFDYDKHLEDEWNLFWKSENLNYTKDFMNAYKRNNLYLFIGEQQKFDLEKISDWELCFSKEYEKGENKIYKYNC